MGADFPTMFHVRESVAGNKNANPQARQAIIDALDPVLNSVGEVLSYRRGWSTKDLCDKHIVFELGGIADAEKDLILNTLLYQEFTSRIARGVSNPRMSLWICCDEAHRMISPANSTGGLSDLITLVRGTGIGVDLAATSSHVAPAILSNSAMKFVGRCGSANDYDAIGSAMGLSTDERRYLAQTLVPGMFVTQVGEGSWRHPFICRVPLMNFDSSGVEQQVRVAVPLLESDRSSSR